MPGIYQQMLNERPAANTGVQVPVASPEDVGIWQKMLSLLEAKNQQQQQQGTGLNIDPEAWKAFQRGFKGQK